MNANAFLSALFKLAVKGQAGTKITIESMTNWLLHLQLMACSSARCELQQMRPPIEMRVESNDLQGHLNTNDSHLCKNTGLLVLLTMTRIQQSSPSPSPAPAHVEHAAAKADRNERTSILQSTLLMAQTLSPDGAMDKSAGEVQGISPNRQVLVGQLISRTYPGRVLPSFFFRDPRGLGKSVPLPSHVISIEAAKTFARQQISAGLWTGLPLGNQRAFPTRDQSAGEVQGIAPSGEVLLGQLIRRTYSDSVSPRYYFRDPRGSGKSAPLPPHITSTEAARTFARKQISAGLWTNLPLGKAKDFPSHSVIVDFGDLNRPWMKDFRSLSPSGLHTALELPNNLEGGKILGQAVLAEGVTRPWPISGIVSTAFKTAYNKTLNDHYWANLGGRMSEALLASVLIGGRKGMSGRSGVSKAPSTVGHNSIGTRISPATLKTAATRSAAQLAQLFTNKEAMHAYIASGAVTYAVQLFENWNHQQRGIDLFKLNASQQNEMLWALGTAPVVGAAGEAVLAPVLNAVQTAWLARCLRVNSRAVTAARLPELMRSLPAKARLEVLALLGRLDGQSARSFFKVLEKSADTGNTGAKLRRVGIVLTAETVEHLGQHWLYLRGRKAVETELKNGRRE